MPFEKAMPATELAGGFLRDTGVYVHEGDLLRCRRRGCKERHPVTVEGSHSGITFYLALCNTTRTPNKYGTLAGWKLAGSDKICLNTELHRTVVCQHDSGAVQVSAKPRPKAPNRPPGISAKAARTLSYCQKFDREHGHPNDLTLDLVQQLIGKGCAYCGEQDGAIGLDRIDCGAGHSSGNIVPACTNCNTTRGNMPYDAWLIVAKGIKEARQAGLMHGWRRFKGGARKPK